jgi:hypothetical protein
MFRVTQRGNETGHADTIEAARQIAEGQPPGNRRRVRISAECASTSRSERPLAPGIGSKNLGMSAGSGRGLQLMKKMIGEVTDHLPGPSQHNLSAISLKKRYGIAFSTRSN